MRANLKGGNASRVVFPETVDDVAKIWPMRLKGKRRSLFPAPAPARVAGRVLSAASSIATDRLNHIGRVSHDDGGGRASAEAGVRLIGSAARGRGRKGCFILRIRRNEVVFIGGNIATNASGARTFKYGPTRKYVLSDCKSLLATGDVINLRAENCTPIGIH